MKQTKEKLFYHVLIKEDLDSGFYSALCLENNVASMGKSKEEAQRNIQEAVELHVRSCVKLGWYELLFRPAPKEKWAEFFKKTKSMPEIKMKAV